MTGSVSRRFSARWRWGVAIVLVIVLNVALLGYQTGECTDYVAESGAQSTCTSGPVIGVAGGWLLLTVSVLAVAYFVFRLIRAQHAR